MLPDLRSFQTINKNGFNDQSFSSDMPFSESNNTTAYLHPNNIYHYSRPTRVRSINKLVFSKTDTVRLVLLLLLLLEYYYGLFSRKANSTPTPTPPPPGGYMLLPYCTSEAGGGKCIAHVWVGLVWRNLDSEPQQMMFVYTNN